MNVLVNLINNKSLTKQKLERMLILYVAYFAEFLLFQFKVLEYLMQCLRIACIVLPKCVYVPDNKSIPLAFIYLTPHDFSSPADPFTADVILQYQTQEKQ